MSQLPLALLLDEPTSLKTPSDDDKSSQHGGVISSINQSGNKQLRSDWPEVFAVMVPSPPAADVPASSSTHSVVKGLGCRETGLVLILLLPFSNI